MNHDLHHTTTEPTAIPGIQTTCDLDREGHCITCSDEALPVKIVSVDHATGLAQIEVQNTIEEIDVTLVDDISVGDIVLVHGGVAIGLA
jgi:hydrogenase maturation factor